jgi:hypothetical protein
MLQDRVQWRVLVKMIMSLWDPLKTGNFFTNPLLKKEQAQ